MLTKIRRFKVFIMSPAPAVLLVFLFLPSARAGWDSPPAPVRTTANGSVAAGVKRALSNLFRAQSPRGNYNYRDADDILRSFPLAGSFSRIVAKNDNDKSFSSAAHASLSKYFKYMLIENDKDGDFLVESDAHTEGPAGTLEDPGFNSMLALDILNLSQTCVDIGLPVEALFWHEQSKLIVERIVDETLEIESKYFYPYNNSRKGFEHLYYATSLLPALFPDALGENIAQTAIRHYLLKPQYMKPESPYYVINMAGDGRIESILPQNILKVVLLLEILHINGFCREEERLRASAAAAIAKSYKEANAAARTPYEDLVFELLENSGYHSFVPEFNALDILVSLIRSKNAVSDHDMKELERNAGFVKKIIETGAESAHRRESPEAAAAIDEQAVSNIRSIYFAVSRIREQLNQGGFRSIWDDKTILGFDVRAAVRSLLPDVISILKRAENIMSSRELARNGLEISCVLMNERRIPREQLMLKIEVTASSRPAKIKSIELVCNPYRRILFNSKEPVSIYPGDTVMTFIERLPLNPDKTSGLKVLDMSLGIIDQNGRKITRNIRKGINIDKPLNFTLNYPGGKILEGATLPVEIILNKNARYGIKVNVSYYSPSGLRIRESNSMQHYMAENEDSASVVLNVDKPSPCRPGSFPFLIKVLANGKDMGMVRGTFFKHYQWIFSGPFEKKPISISASFGPEKRLNLLDRFKAGGKFITWNDLPAYAYGSGGEIILDRIMPMGGTGYLHTVIKSAAPKDCPVYLSSSVPAKLFINNIETIFIERGDINKESKALIHLAGGLNQVLIKSAGSGPQRIFFKLGDDEDLTSDEFNNNLWELVEGYEEFHKRSKDGFENRRTAQKLVTLSYINPDAYSVAVIGSFNGWSAENSSMHKISTGRWEITLHLSPGRHAYRFLINNQQYVLDPRCPYQESDGYGGHNSVLYIE